MFELREDECVESTRASTGYKYGGLFTIGSLMPTALLVVFRVLPISALKHFSFSDLYVDNNTVGKPKKK
ncbi:hypothetical protein [Henriciella barbarensis]|nr:hypothetical protein [Henriciella barbarensis]